MVPVEGAARQRRGAAAAGPAGMTGRARHLEPAPAALSPEAGARALAAGEAMSADDAIAFAAAYLGRDIGGRHGVA